MQHLWLIPALPLAGFLVNGVFGRRLPKAVINAPAIACVNLHASLLPRHRGASPIQAAIREGDDQSGITLMHIAPKLDAGDMILQSVIDLAADETGGSLHDQVIFVFEHLSDNLNEGIPPEHLRVNAYAFICYRCD